MLVTPFGIVMLVRLLQLENALLGICVAFVRFTVFNDDGI